MIENTSFVTTKISRKMKHLSSSTTLIVVNSVSHYWGYVHTTKIGTEPRVHPYLHIHDI